MGWSIGYDENWKRDIGYGVPAVCDHPDCNEKIDRGLSYVCGGEAYGGDRGCGLYFCAKHLIHHVQLPQLCERCSPRVRKPFMPKPDTKEWLKHKATDPSWAEWRAEQEIAQSSVPLSEVQPLIDALEKVVRQQKEVHLYQSNAEMIAERTTWKEKHV